MKTRAKILIVYTDKFSKRNIETSELFDLLSEKFEVTVMDSSVYENRPIWHKIISSRLTKILQYRFSETHQFIKHNLKKKYSNIFQLNNYDKVAWYYGFPFSKSEFIFKALLFLNKCLPSPWKLKTEYSLVFLTGCQEGFPQFVIQKLNKLNIPTICLINSWDHLTFRGPVYDYDCIKKFMVWGSVQEEELIKYHHINSKRILKVGSPQFDFLYKIKNQKSTRSEVHINDDEFVVFLPAYNERHGFNEPDSCECIYNYLAKENIKFKIVLRPYPKDNTFQDRFSNLIKKPNIIVNDIDDDFEQDRKNLSLYLKHCDVVICGPGTVAVEAMFFNIPVLFLAIETREMFKNIDIAKQRFFTDHYQNIVKPGGGFLVENMNELIEKIKLIYENSKLELDAQRVILEEQIYKSDGLSGKRIFDEICALV